MTIGFWINSHWSHGKWCGWKSSLVELGFSSGAGWGSVGADPSWNIPWSFPWMSTGWGCANAAGHAGMQTAVPATHAWWIPFAIPVFYMLESCSLGLDSFNFELQNSQHVKLLRGEIKEFFWQNLENLLNLDVHYGSSENSESC